MTDRLAEMAAFVQAAEGGSFAAAADRLRLSPQMVGKHVAAAEARLGTRLLNRSTRRQSLTEAGLLYLEGCRRTLHAATEADAAVSAQASEPRGTLRITAPAAFGALRLVPAAVAFLRAHPLVSIRFELTDRRVDLVEDGFDAAVRIGELPDSGLVARGLAPYRLIPCASPDYIARWGMPEQPADLRRHECIDYAFSAHPAPALWRFRRGNRSVPVQPAGRLVVDDGRAAMGAALAGGGVVLMGDLLVAEHLAAGRLVRVLPGWDGPSRPVWLLSIGRAAQAAKLRAFLRWAAATFAASGAGPG